MASRDPHIIKRWAVSNEPRGIAVAPDGTIYVGLAKTQSVAAIDQAKGTVLAERILDREEIASTKELVTLRLNAKGDRLITANGSDESATILELPSLKIVREIGIEGEPIRDAVPDPANRYLYLLGRTVHVYDANGETELRALNAASPMAIAVSRDGALLAVVATESYPSGPATVVILYDVATFKEIAREPLETDREIRAALFGAGDSALVVAASDWLGEKSLSVKKPKPFGGSAGLRLQIDFGDLVSSERICLASNAGAQALALGAGGSVVHFPERRCSTSGAFDAAPRRVRSASLYAVAADAIVYDVPRDRIVASDRAGFVTIYKTPLAPIRK